MSILSEFRKPITIRSEMSPIKMTGDENHAQIDSFRGNDVYFVGVSFAGVFKSLFSLSFNILRFIYYVWYFIASNALKMGREEILVWQNHPLGHLYMICLWKSPSWHFITKALHSHHHRSSTRVPGLLPQVPSKIIGSLGKWDYFKTPNSRDVPHSCPWEELWGPVTCQGEWWWPESWKQIEPETKGKAALRNLPKESRGGQLCLQVQRARFGPEIGNGPERSRDTK